MDLLYKKDFEIAQKYWDAFWQHEMIDRPCTSIFAKKAPSAPAAPYVCGVNDDFDMMIERFETYLESHSFLGEAIPGIRPSFGPDQMAAFLGTTLNFSKENNTSWSEKKVTDWNSFLPLKIDTAGICWNKMIEYHKAAEKFADGKCLVYNIDLHSNIDCLEALRGAQNLLYDIVDIPDVIEEAVSSVAQLYKNIYNEFHRYGRKIETGTTSLLHLYSRGRYNPIQADFICMLSPDMFRRFCLPGIIEEAQFLDNCCFHLDGVDSLRHLDDILGIPEIGAIQWIPGAGQKPQTEWPQVLEKIQSAGKAIILYCTPQQVKAIHGKYKPELLVYEVQAESEEQGLELLEWLKRNI